MKVSGFSFIRNAVKYDYPVIEAIQSILPVCDEFVIAVGNSEDNTRQLIEGIQSDKIKIIDTHWDENLREGGRVLAEETNKAFKNINPESDWAFYIQGDEVLHEKYLPVVKSSMEKWKYDQHVEGLLFKYLHFYGSYDYVGDSRRWYRNEIRIIRNDKNISSYKDAQGFRKNNKALHVKRINATIYHYGWVKPPELQQDKQKNFHRYWHNDQWISKNIPQTDRFDYSRIDSLRLFKGSHPEVIRKRIKEKNWTFSFDPSGKNFSFRGRLLHFIENHTGIRIGEYRNYKVI